MDAISTRTLMDEPVKTGTTIMAVVYDGGVILAADSRTSTGTYVANRVQEKFNCLSENVYMLRSGSASDTQATAAYVQHFLNQHTINIDAQCTVKTAANLVMQMAYNNKDMLSMGLIVAGWDKYDGPAVWAVPMGGSLLKVPYAIGCSGSTYISGYCDAYFKENMPKEECMEFVKCAVAHAMARDGSSGGTIRMVTIDAHGAQRHYFQGDQVPLCYDEIKEQ